VRSAFPGTLIALAVLAAGFAVAFLVGRFPVSLADIVAVIWSKLSGGASGVPAATEAVILQVRGPRVVAAFLVGAALAVAGTAFQGLFRNPLVSPDILGASSGAALGAVLGIYFSLGVLAIQLFAFAGGIVAVAAVYLIGTAIRTRDPVLVLVLAGVVIGSLLGAGVGLVKYLADPYNQLPAMTFWLLGSLAAANVADLVPLLGPVFIGSAGLLLLRHRMNVMSLPEEEARALGVPTGPLRVVIVAAATLVTSARRRRSPLRRAPQRPGSSAGSGLSCRISRARWSARILRGSSPWPPCSAAASSCSSTPSRARPRRWRFRSGS
jgi:iron complex transport system permease protein